MKPMWSARFKKSIAQETNDFNESLSFDFRMIEEDIEGSLAHVTMLGKVGILKESDCTTIKNGLKEILLDYQKGSIDCNNSQAEDIHMFIEELLTKKIGNCGKMLHTARSRNDQVALDTRLYVKKSLSSLKKELFSLLEVLCSISKEHVKTILPGYTHLQRAQPISFGFHIMAYAQMFKRDVERMNICYKRTNILPLGSCALAGTSYPIDRNIVKDLLGFDSVSENAMDAVSDRDYLIETLSAISLLMMHISRFSQEIILWCSWEFKFIEIDDAYCTGSSIMPQKKNPDIAELLRGKTGRCYGNLFALLTTLKGLPLAYNKDLQEDKEALFDSLDCALQCIPIFTKMLTGITIKKERMHKAAQKGFINATDVADYLSKKGMPFREAYSIVGTIVSHCIDENTILEDLSMDRFKSFSLLFEDDIKEVIKLENCMEKRMSFGGTSSSETKRQIKAIEAFIKKE